MRYPPVEPQKGLDFTKTVHHDTYPEIDPATKSDCSGKYVFISGASKGLGRATALSYAKAGAEGIAIGARSDLSTLEAELAAAAEAVGKKAPRVLALKLDVLEEASIQAAARRTDEVFGRLDIVINNAGFLSDFVPLLDSDSADYWANYEINLRGIYLTTKAFLPLLLRCGGDRTIINLTSIGALSLFAGASGYQVSKLAVIRFTEFINVDYADQGVLAYSLHPGGVVTELAMKMPQHAHHLLIDTAELASDTIVFLTAQRREWLAGRYISCPWDMPELLSREEEIVSADKLKLKMAF
ncbi:short-chain dehydrogenase [Phlyctema vagabunda]|uniref:Short-chain dehydrogenase n=1 Tax=Phlyctema vagabunda TaxID=108571 RepID=A0ABR4PQB8_9HELO